MAGTTTFATEAGNIGQGIGNFLTPIIGGTQKQTITTAPASNTNTGMYVLIGIGILAAAYFLLKPKTA